MNFNIKYFILLLIPVLLLSSSPIVYATENIEPTSIVTTNPSQTIQTNEIEGWPDGPVVEAESAIIMEASTGTILYEKNINDPHYPASITKIMTTLLAIENSSLDEIVTFSTEAVFGIERNSSHIGIDVGEQLTMEQCLYGIMLASANEVSYAVAEHVAGDLDTFVQMMNDRAAELGCLNTNFVNANGLPDENHYTTVYDMALITKAALKNDIFRKISSTKTYSIPPTNIQSETRYFENHHRMVRNTKYYYDGCFGGKTGYTIAAKNTLVTFANKNNMDLICVTMKTDGTQVYIDTAALLDYGFNNFQKINISDNEQNYTIDNLDIFKSATNSSTASNSLLTLNSIGSIILPNTVAFTEALPQIIYNADNSPDFIATLSYTYLNRNVGSTTIDITDTKLNSFKFGKTPEIDSEEADSKNFITINIKYMIVIGIIVILSILLFGFLFFKSSSSRSGLRFSKRRLRWSKRNKNNFTF